MVFVIQNTLIYAIPLLVVALAGVFAERSGIINIALEGMMIFGSFVGAIFVSAMQRANLLDGHPQIMYILAMLVSAAAGAIFSLLLSFSAINLKADQTIGGTALNMLAPALCNTFALALFMQEKIEMPKSTNYAFVNSNLNGFLRIFADKAYISTYVAIAVFVHALVMAL